MVIIGDFVIVPGPRYGKVVDTFGPACEVQFFGTDERDTFVRSECKKAEHTHPGSLCSHDWCGSGQSEKIFPVEGRSWRDIAPVHATEHVMACAPSDLLGTREVATLLGVTPAAVSNWAKRGRGPRPLAVLACGTIYDCSVVIAWARATGRDAAILGEV
jgi:hypothetical protein